MVIFDSYVNVYQRINLLFHPDLEWWFKWGIYVVGLTRIWGDVDLRQSLKTGNGIAQEYGYGSIPINTIFRGMNIHKSQLFWCEQKGYYWFWHTAILVCLKMGYTPWPGKNAEDGDNWTHWSLAYRIFRHAHLQHPSTISDIFIIWISWTL